MHLRTCDPQALREWLPSPEAPNRAPFGSTSTTEKRAERRGTCRRLRAYARAWIQLSSSAPERSSRIPDTEGADSWPLGEVDPLLGEAMDVAE